MNALQGDHWLWTHLSRPERRSTAARVGVAGMCVLALSGCFNPDDPSLETLTDGSSSSGTEPTTGPTAGPTTASTRTSTEGTSTTTSADTNDTESTASSSTGPDPDTGLDTDTDADTDTDTDADTDTDTGSPACSTSERCVPPIPEGWAGPLVLADDACPDDYPTVGDDLNAGLQPGEYMCSCNCGVQSVTCGLYLENEGFPFNPTQSCESPPFEDECLSAVADATCSAILDEVPATPSWGEERVACSGASAGAACEDSGTCFPAESGSVCISQPGEHTCPEGFGEAEIFYEGFSDDRSCSSCSCSPQGQACSIDAEICSVGFSQITLESGGNCYQLNSGDGDGVSQQSINVSNNGSCESTAGAGMPQGDITETGAVTVCCAG